MLKDVAEIKVTLSASVSSGRNSLQKSFVVGIVRPWWSRSKFVEVDRSITMRPWTKDCVEIGRGRSYSLKGPAKSGVEVGEGQKK